MVMPLPVVAVVLAAPTRSVTAPEVTVALVPGGSPSPLLVVLRLLVLLDIALPP